MPAPMTTTRAASGDVLKRTLLGPVARTVATLAGQRGPPFYCRRRDLIQTCGRPDHCAWIGASRTTWCRAVRGSSVYLSRIRSALLSIFLFSLAVRLPFLTCWVGRALAFRACDLSGIGYFFSSGRPKSDFGSALRFLVVSSAMTVSSCGGCGTGVPSRSSGGDPQVRAAALQRRVARRT